MSIPENFPTYPQADLVREIQRLGVENKRMNERLATQADIIAVWGPLIDKMEEEAATLRARVASLEAALRVLLLLHDLPMDRTSTVDWSDAWARARLALAAAPDAPPAPALREARASIALDRDQTHYVGDGCPGGHRGEHD